MLHQHVPAQGALGAELLPAAGAPRLAHVLLHVLGEGAPVQVADAAVRTAHVAAVRCGHAGETVTRHFAAFGAGNGQTIGLFEEKKIHC